MPDTSKAERITPKSILVVECDPAVAQCIEMVLARDGYAIEIAESVREALSRFAPGKYDVITTTYKLPDGNGLNLAGAIKAIAKAQPVILLSAYAAMGRWTRAELSGFDAVVGKPFVVAELKSAIAKACGKQ